MSTQRELKNCPFCGSEANASTLLGSTHFTCMSCDVSVQFKYPGKHVNEQLRQWNSRAPTPHDIDTANYKDTIRKLEAARWEFKKALAKCYGIAMALCFEENPNYKAAVEKIAKISDEALKSSKGGTDHDN